MAKQWVLWMLCGALVAGAQENSLPSNPRFEDYQVLLKKSPFALAQIKTVAAVKPTPMMSSLSLQGVVKMQGGWLVTLVDKKKPKESFFLEEGKPAKDRRLRLVKVNQNKSDYTKTTVVVLENGRQVTVEYNLRSLKNSLAKVPKTSAQQRQEKPRPTNTSNTAVSPTGQQTPTQNTRRPRVRRPRQNTAPN